MQTETIKVFFRYEKKEVNTPEGVKLVTVPDGSITAIAKNVQTNEEIASREVKLRHGDSSNKLIGRKYAFKKLMNHAMQNNLLPGKEVEALWKEFGSKCKQPNIKLAY